MKSLLLFFATLFTISSFGQRVIKGSISDTTKPLPFANVIVKNTSKGVFTDDFGNFAIEVKPTDILQISYLGYKTKEILVGKQIELKVVLDDYEELDEVVIIGYQFHSICRSTNCVFTTIICECDGEEDSIENKTSPQESEIIKLYPNPSKDGIFNIKLLENISEVNINVADITGRIIFNITHKRINSSIVVDLTNQPSGMYIINVASNGTQIASKKAIRI
nr:carboxypeptidase-like regulatory domain-containing protein [uncultured Psychroserpens sp.]